MVLAQAHFAELAAQYWPHGGAGVGLTLLALFVRREMQRADRLAVECDVYRERAEKFGRELAATGAEVEFEPTERIVTQRLRSRARSIR